MAVPVTLPQLGESVTEGTVTRWLKQPGDTVEVDEPLLEVSTDKVDTEIPSPAAGVLLEITADEDETVEVGGQLGLIGEPDEAPSESGGESGGGDEASGKSDESSESGEGQSAAEEPEPAAAGGESSDQSQPAAPSGGGDTTPITLPQLGESVTEGTVTRWLKQPGDTVEVDEPLLEVSTDKVDTEIPSPAAGVLLEITADEDETVEVGGQLGLIGEPGSAPSESGGGDAGGESAPASAAASEESSEEPGSGAEEETPPAREPEKPAATQAAPAATAADPSGDIGYVTPLVRKLAKEHGVDLSTVEGTGVGGRVRKQDVLAAAEKPKEAAAAAPAARREGAAQEGAAPQAASKSAPPAVVPSSLRGQTEKMSRLRKVIAERMVESLQVAAQLTTVVEVDLTGVARLRARAKDGFLAREGVKLSFMPFLAKAALESLKTHPKLNATMDTEEGTITYFDAEHLGVAVDTERGLLVPVIKNAGDMTIPALARGIADLAERTRTNKIKPDDLAGGTFTLTNTGSRGALFDTPIINQPQVAILGTGSIVKRPVVVSDDAGGEAIAVRSMMYLSLTYDHRLVDGADAARYLNDVKARLEGAQFEAEVGL
jgi:pyruvate dehydrogenase E2 component (dihydrolipoamide acetyltransferase)